MWSPSTTSHVLLAACREDETAREITHDHDGSVHGRFTDCLIRRLRNVLLEDTTYTYLVNLLPAWSGQTPHCGGDERSHLVFNGNFPPTPRRVLPLTANMPPDTPKILQSFRVEMGSVDGVVPGTEFAVLRPDDTILCTLVAWSVRVDQTILVPKPEDRYERPIDLPSRSRVVVSDWRKNHPMLLHVYTPADFPYTSDLFPTTNISSELYVYEHNFVQAPSPDKADIIIRKAADSNEIVIERLTGTLLESQRETRFPLKANTSFPFLVNGIAHFHYFLDSHHGSAPLEGFSVEMHRLMGDYPDRRPDPNVGHDGNMIDLHEARFSSEMGAKYGFTMRNASAEDLFPYIFYFDPVMYTIQCWYSPAAKKDVEPPLLRGGALTIGMDQERAFEFMLEPGESESSGIVKLFVSTTPPDFEPIAQQLTPSDPSSQYVRCPRFKNRREPMADTPRWDALSVMLTMTR
ncbi:hypothetical protein C8R44DRAFT_191438 [Mycena epipterygia]|nr:hypothetical protein C8R44DRAFT_191438 [Mycena epipterygia]